MCKASIVAKKQVDARAGQNLSISQSAHGLGAFHEKGTALGDCVTCVKNGTTLTLNGIPFDLQKQYGLGSREVAKFIDTGDNSHDYLLFQNGSRVNLIDFAGKNATAYVGALENVSETGKGAGFGAPARAHETIRA